MRIAILDGTDNIGGGLALRFAADTSHGIVIGSRKESKAADSADSYESRLADHGIERTIEHADSTTATSDADIVVLATPPHHVGDSIKTLVEQEVLADQILITPAVGMRGDGAGLQYDPPSTGSMSKPPYPTPSALCASVPEGKALIWTPGNQSPAIAGDSRRSTSPERGAFRLAHKSSALVNIPPFIGTSAGASPLPDVGEERSLCLRFRTYRTPMFFAAL
jgi:hypothetical protein